ncbi:TPA: CBASS cGAMP synthase [Vibrio diabolicus]
MSFDITKSLNNPQKGFISEITPDVAHIDKLRKIREEIRNELREKFQDLASCFENDGGRMRYTPKASTNFLSDDLKKLSHEQKKSLSKLKPKFASQGSFVYKTMNSPCQPPQQMDLDDGIYLPLDMFEDKPLIGKDLFFNYVDKTLSNLAERKGWRFSDEKNTCARLIIDRELHVDIPLYAVPKERHLAMLENVALNAMDGASTKSETTARLEPNEVNLALRNAESWTVSDPAVLNDYFKHNFKFYKELVGGEDVCRRVSRYLKAWRDHAFNTGGPSSVSLMMCVVLSFQEMSRTRSMNKLTDGEALAECAKRLPDQLRSGVINDAEKGKEEILFPKKDMTESETEEVYQAANEFFSSLQKAVNAKSKDDAISYLQNSFGSRFPNLPELLISFSSVATAIRSQPAKAQPQPDVVNQDAG